MDSFSVRLTVLVALVLVTLLLGVRLRAGRGRPRAVSSGPRVSPRDLGVPLGARATLLQVSSAACAPCRAARRVLASVAGTLDGVRHLEVDAEQEIALVRRLQVLRTPTVLILDGAGTVVGRFGGVPSPDQVRQALALAFATAPGRAADPGRPA